MTAPDDVRARFEAWAVSQRYYVDRAADGSYKSCRTHDAWEGYRAAYADRDAEVRELRRLLAVRVAGAMLYTDDGELSDASVAPHIDFLRDSAAEIARKLRDRANAHSNLPDCAANFDWPAGKRFDVRDEPGEHDPCYLVLPDGAMLAFVHHAINGVDQARAKFIADACNAALAKFTQEKP